MCLKVICATWTQVTLECRCPRWTSMKPLKLKMTYPQPSVTSYLVATSMVPWGYPTGVEIWANRVFCLVVLQNTYCSWRFLIETWNAQWFLCFHGPFSLIDLVFSLLDTFVKRTTVCYPSWCNVLPPQSAWFVPLASSEDNKGKTKTIKSQHTRAIWTWIKWDSWGWSEFWTSWDLLSHANYSAHLCFSPGIPAQSSIQS